MAFQKKGWEMKWNHSDYKKTIGSITEIYLDNNLLIFSLSSEVDIEKLINYFHLSFINKRGEELGHKPLISFSGEISKNKITFQVENIDFSNISQAKIFRIVNHSKAVSRIIGVAQKK